MIICSLGFAAWGSQACANHSETKISYAECGDVLL